ncbi:hypothetical protein [Halobellus limi]|uniref:Uncharacterized protein n=1 Tax=Halobellus limi TaxID=699433 RepID=A0A1H5YJY2_9EURY|nr:hypothetical protein [Halobellus limi]QCC48427.1 hypothetical protein DV707_12540 [Halobellus limi]SEG24294.1 hypothetical protein SAMN04488133_1624 [Halobellus limi]
MHATAVETSNSNSKADRTRATRRIDVTDVATAQVAEYAERRAADTNAEVRIERRGGWTYLVEDR